MWIYADTREIRHPNRRYYGIYDRELNRYALFNESAQHRAHEWMDELREGRMNVSALNWQESEEIR